jgi:hypothetical protein
MDKKISSMDIHLKDSKKALEYAENLYQSLVVYYIKNTLVIKYIKDKKYRNYNNIIYIAFMYRDDKIFTIPLDFPFCKLKDLIQLTHIPYCFIKIFHDINNVEFIAFNPLINTSNIYENSQVFKHIKEISLKGHIIQLDLTKMKSKLKQVLKQMVKDDYCQVIVDDELSVFMARIYFNNNDDINIDLNLPHSIYLRNLFNDMCELDIDEFIKKLFRIYFNLEMENIFSAEYSFYNQYPQNRTTKLHEVYDQLSTILEQIQYILQHEELLNSFLQEHYKKEILSKCEPYMSLQQIFNDFKYSNYSFIDLFTRIKYLIPTINIPYVKEYVIKSDGYYEKV